MGLQPLNGIAHGVVLDARNNNAGRSRVGFAAFPVEPLDRQVICLGTTGGKDNLGSIAASNPRDTFAGVLDGSASRAAR